MNTLILAVSPTDSWAPLTVALMWQGFIFLIALLVVGITALVRLDMSYRNESVTKVIHGLVVVLAGLTFLTFCAATWSSVLI